MLCPRQSPRRKRTRKLPSRAKKYFTIGSPLGLKKIITSGIVSKVEARAIISDVNINHGNSGGPLFNSLGEVIGITTFLVPGGNGPGVTGVVRIDQALPTGASPKKDEGCFPPSARLLPVEPTDPYPLNSLKEMIKSEVRPQTIRFHAWAALTWLSGLPSLNTNSRRK
jgi:hypothetical protein